jgi:catechol 2,3-dioxygenase-like lactoylglutathione lyase family enzyme
VSQQSSDGSWASGISAITLFVDDVAAAKSFYEEVFELAAVYEDEVSTVFKFGGTLVNLLQRSEAPQLVTPARVAASEDSAARALLTITVEDVDAVCERLRQRGVELLNGPVDRPWGIRTAAFRDPGGHFWEIAR